MRHGSGLVLALIWAGSGLAEEAAPAAEPAGASEDVSVTVVGLRSGKGKVLACLTSKPKTFPDCSKDPAAKRAIVGAAKGEVTFDFGAVAPGTYAVSLFHDENGNGKLDTMMAIPREGYGFSRDAAVMFGPPRFAAAAVAVERAALHLKVKMRYLL
ncbi:DUF2141 domain-containing protein [Novosphingobium flavum]|uniref:DUF2141 domain-containing protein n=1 Tax=Novosphingobium flavum TaxID=1778672 RepID=UPI0031B6148A